jgi:uncharacterized damage-inducible protein DinB
MTLLIPLYLVTALSAPGSLQAPTNATIGSARGAHDLVKGWLLKAAEQVPEEHYAFKPTPEVRSMGEIFGHVADSNFLICGMVSGEKPPMSNIAKTNTTRADLRDALAASFKFCDAAYDGMTDARASEVIKFFIAGTHTRLGVLAFNNAHDFEHYGNIVTYMRLKGMVPPSSGGGM